MPRHHSTRSGIYAIRHVASGKLYIGSAVNIPRRWKRHRCSLANGTHHSRYLQRAWNKYGAEAFAFEVLQIVPARETIEETKAELVRIEQEYIDRFEAAWRTKGYNVVSAAESPMLGRRHSREARAKIAAASRSRSPETLARIAIASRDRIASPETRAKLSEAGRGRIFTAQARAKMVEAARNRGPEWRAKLSAANRGKRLSLEHRAAISAAVRNPSDEVRQKIGDAHRGKPKSPEHRAKLSAANRGRICSPEARAKMSAAAKARQARKRDGISAESQ